MQHGQLPHESCEGRLLEEEVVAITGLAAGPEELANFARPDAIGRPGRRHRRSLATGEETGRRLLYADAHVQNQG